MDGRVTAERAELGQPQIAKLQERIRRQCTLVDRLLAEGRDAPVIRNEEDDLGKILSAFFTLLTTELDGCMQGADQCTTEVDCHRMQRAAGLSEPPPNESVEKYEA